MLTNPAPTSAPSAPPARARQSGAQRILSLPTYDIRIRRELAQRRLLLAVARHTLRVVSLHVADSIAIAAAAWCAFKVLPEAQPASLLPALVASVLVGLNARGAYRAAASRRDPARIGTAILSASVLLLVMTVLPPHIAMSPPLLVYFGIFAMGALLLERWLIDLVVRQVYAHGIGLRRAVIIGRGGDLDHIVACIGQTEHRDHRIVGYVTPTGVHDPEALGSVDELEAILDREEPVEVMVTTALRGEVLRRVVDACVRRGIYILAVPSWTERMNGWAEPVKIGNLPGFRVHPARLTLPWLVVKRFADVVLTVLGLIVCLPVMGVIALAIKLDSRGPVFFRQRRVGVGGREFDIWKFRSMSVEAESKREEIAHLNPYTDGRLFKLRRDPRVTRVGRWLRRFSLDELPQLFNVLRGDMSLVGPRPPLPSEVRSYEARHYIRLSVVPGLTGPWQVGGRNLITDFEHVVRLERDYIERWSLRLDLRIMFKTIFVVLKGEGAY
ncbi:MAG TPA: sugar transferase [Gemmatimonadaceae bacterium]|nr:sugar transferase [Gemmatimonadaceae bacterium]